MGKCVTPLKEWSSIPKNVHVTQGITLEALHRDKHQEIKLKQTQQIKDVVYRYLLTIGQGLLRYTSINLEEDSIIDSMFMIFKQQPCFF